MKHDTAEGRRDESGYRDCQAVREEAARRKLDAQMEDNVVTSPIDVREHIYTAEVLRREGGAVSGGGKAFMDACMESGPVRTHLRAVHETLPGYSDGISAHNLEGLAEARKFGEYLVKIGLQLLSDYSEADKAPEPF